MKKQLKRNKGIKRETVMLLTLNAFVLGMLIQKISIYGLSCLTTIYK